jgi:hypothetical protein
MKVATDSSISTGNERLSYNLPGEGISGDGRNVANRGSRGLAGQSNSGLSGITSEYYSCDTFSLTCSNADGDSVSIDMQHIRYQKIALENQRAGQTGEWQEMADFVKDEMDRLRGEILDRIISCLNGEKPADKTDETDNSEEIPGLPEYWNAENTSQRIVDFAVSFYGAFEGAGEEFLSMIKSAIDEGFKQAGDITGELPGAVAKLVGNTHDLVMEKLDQWAAQQGIGVAEQQAA